MNWLKLCKMNDIKTFSKVIRDAEINFPRNGYDNIPFGENRVRANEEDFDSTPEIQTAFTDTSYKFIIINMDDKSVLISVKS